MSVLGIGKEFCRQLYFRDDNSFIFRSLPIENNFVIEKQGENTKAAWLMPYRVLKRFEGMRSIKAGMVLLSYGRDIVLDKWGQISDDEKPEQGRSLIKDMISRIATGVFYQHETGKKKSVIEKMVLFVGSLMVGLGLVIGIIAVARGGLN